MQLLERVKDNPNICSVELGFSGELLAANIPDWQPFFNSSMLAIDFSKTHIGLGSVAFAEESEDSPAGTSYKQSVTIRFPATDKNRSERIALMAKVRFVKLKLTNGLDLIIGRNDFEQNARPRIKTKTNIKTAEAVFETVSIVPAGFVVNLDFYALPIILTFSY